MGKDHRLYVGVDLGGTNIQAGVLDSRNHVLGRAKAKTQADEGAEHVVQRVAEAVRDALEDARAKREDVAGVCVGAPGTVDIHTGMVVNATNLRWNNFPLGKALSAALKMRVTIDNDVNVGTWGEYVAGAGQGHQDVLGVFVGTGIGGGVVLGGKLYHGHFLTAGEIGQTVIQADGTLGRRTVENLASRTAIVNLLVQLIRANHPSKLSKLVRGDMDKIRSKALAEALRQHDKLTQDVIRQAASYVGGAIANAVTLLSLPCVVLGGGLTEALGQAWVEPVKKAFERDVFPPELRACKLVAGKLGDDAGIVGAALLARQRMGEKPKK